jgi:hypothetical protein
LPGINSVKGLCISIGEFVGELSSPVIHGLGCAVYIVLLTPILAIEGLRVLLGRSFGFFVEQPVFLFKQAIIAILHKLWVFGFGLCQAPRLTHCCKS